MAPPVTDVCPAWWSDGSSDWMTSLPGRRALPQTGTWEMDTDVCRIGQSQDQDLSWAWVEPSAASLL